jgi:mono/diheme cytochrome c family protein
MRQSVNREAHGKRTAGLLLVLVLATVALAAGAQEEGTPLIGDVTNGTRLYRVHCAVCHGFDGSGKGAALSTLKTKPADHRDGSLMNARDNQMLFRVIQAGCKGVGCKGAMPSFSNELDKLDTFDLVAYLRSLHMPLAAFFPKVDQYLVKQYTIGKIGKEEFREGQLERLEEVLQKVKPSDLTHTVFTLFRADRSRPNPELIPQEPRRLAELKKRNKIGYVFFMVLDGPRGRKVPVGIGLDTGYNIVKLITTLTDAGLSGEYNKRFDNYVGLGKRGQQPEFDLSKDKVGKVFDKAVTRIYMLAVEAANAYESEERERSWADGTF